MLSSSPLSVILPVVLVLAERVCRVCVCMRACMCVCVCVCVRIRGGRPCVFRLSCFRPHVSLLPNVSLLNSHVRMQALELISSQAPTYVRVQVLKLINLLCMIGPVERSHGNHASRTEGEPFSHPLRYTRDDVWEVSPFLTLYVIPVMMCGR